MLCSERASRVYIHIYIYPANWCRYPVDSHFNSPHILLLYEMKGFGESLSSCWFLLGQQVEEGKIFRRIRFIFWGFFKLCLAYVCTDLSTVNILNCVFYHANSTLVWLSVCGIYSCVTVNRLSGYTNKLLWHIYASIPQESLRCTWTTMYL